MYAPDMIYPLAYRGAKNTAKIGGMLIDPSFDVVALLTVLKILAHAR